MRSLSNTSPSISQKNVNANTLAVRFSGVCKEYRLYDSLAQQAIDVLGLSKLQFWRPTQYKTFVALDGIDLEIQHGERVGLIGPNGAGKTTLLKLITGNFTPTSGKIEINGDVQALMQTGLGFHGDFTGFENIKSSLIYSGLSGKELDDAAADIIDFCELGDFLYQPVKTYSLGMRARLQFAAATAIKPDIVIVDEVLGAGDAYFSAKSSARMTKLADSGCTLLIVSHSMQQVLQFCQRAIWLDRGRIIADDKAISIVKDYERVMFERQVKLGKNLSTNRNGNSEYGGKKDRTIGTEMSRWAEHGSSLFIEKVRLLNSNGDTCLHYEHGDPLTIQIEIKSKEEGIFPCSIVFLIFNSAGIQVTWHLSEQYSFKMKYNETKFVKLHFDRILLNTDTYMISTAIYKHYDAIDKRKAKRYDLLNRSFMFQVGKDFSGNPAIFHHPAHWDPASSSG